MFSMWWNVNRYTIDMVAQQKNMKLEIRSVERGICPIAELSLLWPTLSFFNAHVQNCFISTSSLKSDVTIMFLDPDFLHDAGIPVIREDYRYKLVYLFAWIFRTFWPKPFGGQNRRMGGAMLTPMNSFLLLGVVTLLSLLAKINQEMQP